MKCDIYQNNVLMKQLNNQNTNMETSPQKLRKMLQPLNVGLWVKSSRNANTDKHLSADNSVTERGTVWRCVITETMSSQCGWCSNCPYALVCPESLSPSMAPPSWLQVYWCFTTLRPAVVSIKTQTRTLALTAIRSHGNLAQKLRRKCKCWRIDILHQSLF